MLKKTIKELKNILPNEYKILLDKSLYTSYCLVKLQISQLNFYDVTKNFLIRELLLQKYKSICFCTLDFIKDIGTNPDYDFKHLANDLVALVDKIITDYETKILDAYKNKFGNYYGNEIFKIVYYGDNGFFLLHANQVDFVFNIIKLIEMSNFENFNIIHVSMFIDCCQLAFSISFQCIYGIINNLNGHLTLLVQKASENLPV